MLQPLLRSLWKYNGQAYLNNFNNLAIGALHAAVV